jgi:hypothetical protein
VTDVVAGFGTLDPTDKLLAFVSVAVLALAALAFLFAVIAFILRLRNDVVAARWQALEATWEGALLDVLGGETHSSAILARVARRDTLYFVDYLSRFARRLRGSERERVAAVAGPFLPQVARQLRSRTAGVRARAVRTLGLLGLRQYSYEIIAALDDASPLVAMTAARELSRREQPEYAHAVLLKLGRFREWSAAYLSTMLAAVGPAVAPFLRGALSDRKEDVAVRVVAAEALRLLNDIPAAEVAAQVVEKDDNRELVSACLRLIGTAGSGRHTAVVRRLARSADDVIRANALGALGTIGDAHDVPLLRASLDEPGVWVAWHAARSLIAVGSRAVVAGIAESTHRHADLARELLVTPA